VLQSKVMTYEQLIAKIKKFPDTPGVYLMRAANRQILYIGKASSLRRRVISYFQRPQEARIEKMVSQISTIEIKKTESVIEALLLENDLIKKYQPKYNVKLKDDKTFLGIFVTSEDWPKVMPARLTEKLPKGEFFGPFPNSGDVRDALQIIRKIFPFRYACEPLSGKACFEYHMGLCPGVCTGKIEMKEYQRTVKKIKLFLHGKKKTVISNLEKEMRQAAKNLDYEKAAKMRDQVFALKHIQDVTLMTEENFQEKPTLKRIEAYDISNISGEFAVGSMVVFTDGLLDKSQYRKFKIKSVKGANDIAMLKEVLVRRLNHTEWPMSELILVDGGRGQVNAFMEIIAEKKLNIPIIGIAKGKDRKGGEIIGLKNLDIDKIYLLRLRDEAHRFAISYYRTLHQKSLK